MVNGVIVRPLQSLDKILTELRSLGEVQTPQLEHDWRTQRAIERDLQVLVEIVIDVCQRLISLAGQTPAATGTDAIDRCIALGVLSNDEIYHKMIRFRNFTVHRYEDIAANVLVDMVNQHLPDFEQFRDEVLAYVHDN